MKIEYFTIPLTVKGKKVKGAGSKFRIAGNKLYRISIPWDKWEKVFIYKLEDPVPYSFSYSKGGDKFLDSIAEEIKNKLQKSRV